MHQGGLDASGLTMQTQQDQVVGGLVMGQLLVPPPHPCRCPGQGLSVAGKPRPQSSGTPTPYPGPLPNPCPVAPQMKQLPN